MNRANYIMNTMNSGGLLFNLHKEHHLEIGVKMWN